MEQQAQIEIQKYLRGQEGIWLLDQKSLETRIPQIFIQFKNLQKNGNNFVNQADCLETPQEG